MSSTAFGNASPLVSVMLKSRGTSIELPVGASPEYTIVTTSGSSDLASRGGRMMDTAARLAGT
ncbi:hypothetical protein [Paraburkholderia silvatlantica]|uniref:hypothetical protein n=1 Tax=Paraburkholderia silvatlantica TaxID=321895 RepID=UPI0037538E80